MIRVAIAVGALFGVGLVLLVSGLRSAPPPRLDAVLARLRGEDPDPPTSGGLRLLARAADRVAGHVRIPQQDLALLGMSRQRFVTEKILMAAGCLVAPAVLAALATAEGATPPWTLPTGAAVVLAIVGWFVPDLTARQTAAARRTDFLHALSAYFDVVRLGFGGGLGPSEALERAPLYSGGWAFRRIADAIESARYTRIPPWQALARLGEEIGVTELTDLADLAELAGQEGAQISAAITAYTQQMRGRRLAELRYQAGSRTTTMTAPIAMLGLAFVAMVAFPQIYLLLMSG